MHLSTRMALAMLKKGSDVTDRTPACLSIPDERGVIKLDHAPFIQLLENYGKPLNEDIRAVCEKRYSPSRSVAISGT